MVRPYTLKLNFQTQQRTNDIFILRKEIEQNNTVQTHLAIAFSYPLWNSVPVLWTSYLYFQQQHPIQLFNGQPVVNL